MNSERLQQFICDDPIVVTGMGVHCAAGTTVGALWSSVVSGVVAARQIEFEGGVKFAACVAEEIEYGGDARLLSGEPLDEAIDAVAPFGPLAVGVNCLPPESVPPCLGVLQRADLPFLVYANLIGPGERRSPQEYARLARGWIEAGARIVGGCCGTRPEHIRALSGGADANCVTDAGSTAHELPAREEAEDSGPTKSRS